jgi:hypothetical protein
MAAPKNGKRPEPQVEHFPNGWTLVTAGSWQISVAPEGLLMLPRHLVPAEVGDFCAAALAAAEEGAAKIKENQENETPMGVPPPAVAVTEGPPPPGYTAMPVIGGPNQPPGPTSSIGRRTRNPRAPRSAMPGVRQQPRLR